MPLKSLGVFLDFYSNVAWTELICVEAGANAGSEVVAVPSLMVSVSVKAVYSKVKVVRDRGQNKPFLSKYRNHLVKVNFICASGLCQQQCGLR